MDLQKIFAPLSEALTEANMGYADVFECLGASALGSQQVAAAFAFNIRDFLRERDKDAPVPTATELLVEAYWRTFFNKETAEKYETAHMYHGGRAVLSGFVDYMVGSLKMDKSQNTPVNSDAQTSIRFN